MTKRELIDEIIKRTEIDPYKLKRQSKAELEKLLSTLTEQDKLIDSLKEQKEAYSNISIGLKKRLEEQEKGIQAGAVLTDMDNEFIRQLSAELKIGEDVS
jgi:hypothetical protein